MPKRAIKTVQLIAEDGPDMNIVSNAPTADPTGEVIGYVDEIQLRTAEAVRGVKPSRMGSFCRGRDLRRW